MDSHGQAIVCQEVGLGKHKDDKTHLQGSAKEWSLGCVKRAPTARVIRDMGITQPKDHYLADPCINGVLH